MEYRRMGKTGLQLSVLSYGSWVTFHKQVDDNIADELMGIAYDNGVNFFDNAEVYARGESEKLMGRVLKKKKWDRTSVDYIYSSGDKFHKISGYDMSSNVTVGESIDLGVDMQAPKNSGTYTTTWTMRAGSKTFCNMTLTIVVK